MIPIVHLMMFCFLSLVSFFPKWTAL